MNLIEEEIIAFIAFAEKCYQFQVQGFIDNNQKICLQHHDGTTITIGFEEIIYKRPDRPAKNWSKSLKDSLHWLRMSREQMTPQKIINEE